MRIIAGKFRGRQLRAPSSLPVRPTTDQAKEALFNILGHQYHFPDISVLELFAGTGNVSYEFASRGVTELTCVDRHPGCVRYMKATFTQLGVSATVRKADAFKFVATAQGQWDLIFLDPPYGLGNLEQVVIQVFDRKLLLPDGQLILEHPPQESYEQLKYFRESRKYGSSVFSFFEVSA